MSAAEAEQSRSVRSVNAVIPKKAETAERRTSSEAAAVQHDLVIDGKAVKASYNAGVKERFVHVTEIGKDSNDNGSRFITGARPTECDRNGEWGAAVSIPESLPPLPGDRVIVLSGDAGFCAEEFCERLNREGFFYIFRIKKNAGNIFLRVSDRASDIMKRSPDGDYHHVRAEGGEIHSRILRRIQGLRHAVYPGRICYSENRP